MTKIEELRNLCEPGRLFLFSPEDLIKILDLVEMQQANLKKIQEHSFGSSVNYAWCKEAITAFKEWNKP